MGQQRKAIEIENNLGNLEEVKPVYVGNLDVEKLQSDQKMNKLIERARIDRLDDTFFKEFVYGAGESKDTSKKSKKEALEDLGADDSEFDEMSIPKLDSDKCLSLWQPWASLLVKGHKRHEGRTWYTPHRGYLWISAGSKKLEKATFDSVVSDCITENLKNYNSDITDNLPDDYPISYLLGRVFIKDCMDQASYRKKYPNGTSTSEYVLICEEAEELPYPLPLSSEHKIFDLNQYMLEAASQQLI